MLKRRIWILSCMSVSSLHLAENDDEINAWMQQKVKTHGIIVLVIMWKVWYSRNKIVFEEHATVGVMVAQIRSLLKDVVQAYGVYSEVVNTKLPREVSWIKPTEGYGSLNVDGSALTNPVVAGFGFGFGGLIRHHDGIFLHRFYGSVGYSNILHAELVALLQGGRMGFRKVICCSDSLLVIKLAEDGDSNFHRVGNEIAVVRNMLLKDCDFQLYHTLQEGNNCADFLAKMGASCSSSLEILDSTPSGMDSLFLADALGVSFVRPN